MSASINLLDKYKKVCCITSDNAAGASLGVTRATVSGWRVGKSHPNASAVETMCKALNEPLRQWLPLIEAERSATPSDKQVWLRLAQTAAAATLIYLTWHSGAQSSSLAFIPVLYIMRNYGQKVMMSRDPDLSFLE